MEKLIAAENLLILGSKIFAKKKILLFIIEHYIHIKKIE